MPADRVTSVRTSSGDCAAAADAARFTQVEDYKGAIFFLTVGSLWFGVSNAAREIVGGRLHTP